MQQSYRKGAYGRTGSSRAVKGALARKGFIRQKIQTQRYAPLPTYRLRLPASQGVRSRSSEIKCVDIAALNYTIGNETTNAHVFLLNGIQEGTGEFNRIGRKVLMKSIHMKGFLQGIQAITSPDDIMRLIILYDRAPNSRAALPPFTEMFQDTSQAGALSNNALSSLNIDYKDRFSILMDHKLLLPASPTGAIATEVGTLTTLNGMEGICQKFIKINLETQFSSTANPCTVTNINTGALYFIAIGANVTTANAYWGLNASFRLRFSDV